MATVITFAVNKNSDLYLDQDGNIAIVSDLEATLQSCNQAVKVRLGEIVLDTSKGIPYFEVVFVGVPNLQIFNAAIKQAIISEPGVVQILKLATAVSNNTLNYAAEIQTVYGIGAINGVIL